MIGPEGAATRAATWLTDRVPARLRLAETRLGLAPATLPNPALVLDHDTGPLALEDWPALLVLPQGLGRLDPVEEALDDGGKSYRATYTLRVLIWVRADGYGPTDTLRKRYVLAVREALLERVQLYAAPAYGQADPDVVELAVAPESLRESYSDVLVDDANRTIAGAYLDVDVRVVEVLDGPAPLGTANEVTVRESTLAPDPASLTPHPAL